MMTTTDVDLLKLQRGRNLTGQDARNAFASEVFSLFSGWCIGRDRDEVQGIAAQCLSDTALENFLDMLYADLIYGAGEDEDS